MSRFDRIEPYAPIIGAAIGLALAPVLAWVYLKIFGGL